MADIVERLHGNVPMIWCDEGFMITDDDTVLATFKEAADEIKRLRVALRRIESVCAEDGIPHAIRSFRAMREARTALGEDK